MDITKENIDQLNAVLSIRLEAKDYEERVNTVLTDYRRKARIDGFRPGKVPFGLISKMYRKPVLVDEINKLVSESVSSYLAEQKLYILGDPIPSKKETKSVDWDHDSEFEFAFDLGLAPEIDVTVSPKDKITYYRIETDDEVIGKYIESYTQRFGSYKEAEEIAEKDIIKAAVAQVDSDGYPLEGGLQVEDASLSAEVIKDEKIKKQFLAAKKGDKLIIDLRKAYPSDAELAGILQVTKDKIGGIEGNFSVSIHEISRFEHAKINQELFDKVFGEGTVNSEEEFKSKIAEEAERGLRLDADYRFRIDTKELMMKKFTAPLPEEFLKRWLTLANEGKYTEEQIDHEFVHFLEDLKWQLIKDKIVKENKLEVNEENMKSAAKDYARIQFSQYGMSNIPDEHLEEFAQRMLAREEDRKNIAAKAIEEKIFEFVKSVVKIDEKKITVEKFNKLFEK